jgi:hypothetical protein
MRKRVGRREYERVLKLAREAIRLASQHDPDHEHSLKLLFAGEECNRKWQEGVEDRLAVIERQMERLGAPQYRIVHINGKPPLIVERVKLPALGK